VGPRLAGDELVAEESAEVVRHARCGVLLQWDAEERGDGSPELGVLKARGEVGEGHQRRKERHHARVAESERWDPPAGRGVLGQHERREL
jgi:hypothetical protein